MSDDLSLYHFGVPGMKWGRRKNSTGTPAPKPRQSADYTRFEKARQKVKAGGTRTLSDKEYRDMISRMNLDQQYSTMTKKQSTISKGKAALATTVSIGSSIMALYALTQNPLVKQVKSAIVNTK